MQHTREVTWSTNAHVATVRLTARAEIADVVGRRELPKVVARELEVGVGLVDVDMVYKFRELYC